MESKVKPQPRVSTANLGVGLPSGAYSAAGGTPSWRSGPSPSPTPPVAGMTPTTPLPPPTNAVPRALTERESHLVKHLSRLQFFLATAPTRWMGGDDSSVKTTSPFHSGSLASPHPNLNRFLLPNGEHVACVFWNGLYHITGTDIVRALVFRFEAFSRPVRNMKKFEEGVFSDLRNLKPGTDACLEEPKSPFLDLLFRNGCIRTQKKQKVFYWFSVPHDRLFLDALERDLKREKMGLEPTTVVVGEPARSFRYDPKRSLFEQFAGKQPGLEESVNPNSRSIDPASTAATNSCQDHALEKSAFLPETEDSSPNTSVINTKEAQTASSSTELNHAHCDRLTSGPDKELLDSQSNANTVLFSRSLLKGSPAYKQGRRKSSREKKHRQQRAGTATTNYDTGDDESGSDSDRLHRSEYSFSIAGDEAPVSTSNYIPPPIYADIRGSPVHFDGASPAHSRQLGPASLTGSLLPLSNTIPPSRAHPSSWSTNVLQVTPSDRMAPSSSYTNFASTGHPAHHHPLGSSAQGALSASSVPSKGFSCPLLSCGRLFKRLEHLKRHVRTHTQERPYECTRCAKRFSRSDNLTQHIKTHEKADRGERMKTEASESTEDDIAIMLEAEVDAMAARESRGHPTSTNSSIINSDHIYSLAYGENTSALQGHFSPARLPMLPPSFAGTEDIGGNTIGTVHAGRTPSVRPDWSSLGNPVPPMFRSVAENAFSTKRHRSMTPNLPPSGRTSLTEPHVSLQPSSSYLGASRYHPYISSTTVHPGSHPYTRATSLDPSAFLGRTPGYDGYSMDHASQDPLPDASKEIHPFASFATSENATNSDTQSYGLSDMISDEVLPTLSTRFQGVQPGEPSKD
ncbi:hypothetical protein I203_107555 [Kwoniella mangroviensis CBS 8507]|uniref:hypothetical protein n=1 Tax=Kwoniella mangroviensis CBS 8507 TaxID=1296122 RepID=UPI003037FB10